MRLPPSGATVSVIGTLITGGDGKSLLYGPKTSVSIVPLFDSRPDELDRELVLVLRREERVRRVVRGRPDAPAHVRNAEARDEPAVVVVHGRERHGHVHDDRVDPLLARELPERRPAAVIRGEGDLSRKKRRDSDSYEVKRRRASGTLRGDDDPSAEPLHAPSKKNLQDARGEDESQQAQHRRNGDPIPLSEQKSFFPSSAIANSGR